jgi:hypothetical protein
MNRRSKLRVLNRVFEKLQIAKIVCVKIEAVMVDSTIVKAHPDSTGALKSGRQSIRTSRGGWTGKTDGCRGRSNGNSAFSALRQGARRAKAVRVAG